MVRRRTEQAGAAYVAVQTAQVEELERTLPAPPQAPAVQLLSVDGAMVPLVQGEWAEVKTVLSALRALREEVVGPAPAGPPDTASAEKRAAQIQYAVFAAQGYPRGKYAVFAAQGYPRGSGSVESANKLVVEVRLKGTGMRAGMRWARPHVNPLVVLRTVACSDRRAEAWPQITAPLRAQVGERRQARRVLRPAAPPVEPAPAAPTVSELMVTVPPPQPPAAAVRPRSRPRRPAADHPWRHSPLGRARCA